MVWLSRFDKLLSIDQWIALTSNQVLTASNCERNASDEGERREKGVNAVTSHVISSERCISSIIVAGQS
jgi:hypothetical protein